MPANNIYARIIERIFFKHYEDGARSVEFSRDEISAVASALGISTPRNLGDVVYSFRYRRSLPDAIVATCPEGEEWVIRTVGSARYRFDRVPVTRIDPNPNLLAIKIPDATPSIVAQHSLSDEQAVLARVRYNRLIDVFTGVVAYSLQNHLRTQLDGGIQIEIDELYVGVNRSGAQFIIPVQAKGGSDRIGRIQLEQDMAYCAAAFPDLVCLPIAAYRSGDEIAMFRLTVEDEVVRIVDERHYRLVAAETITATDLRLASTLEEA